MVFPTRSNFPGQGTYFEQHKPPALGKANQKVYGHGPDGQGDAIIDHINDKLSHAVKDPSFDSRRWADNAPAERLIGTHADPVVAPKKSLTPQLLAIVAVALVAAILAYTRPDIFADLFKLFIGYEVFSLIVGVVLIVLLLVVFLLK